MEQMIYKMEDYSKELLKKHKFKYSSYLSEIGDEVYTYKFPVLYSIKTPVIDPAYYNQEYGNYKNIMRLIDTKINRKLKELGIEKL